jgi:hypothetical protein
MKNKNNTSEQDNKETAIVRREMWVVTGLNLMLLLGLMALYFWNHATGSVDGFFDQIIKY